MNEDRYLDLHRDAFDLALWIEDQLDAGADFPRLSAEALRVARVHYRRGRRVVTGREQTSSADRPWGEINPRATRSTLAASPVAFTLASRIVGRLRREQAPTYKDVDAIRNVIAGAEAALISDAALKVAAYRRARRYRHEGRLAELSGIECDDLAQELWIKWRRATDLHLGTGPLGAHLATAAEHCYQDLLRSSRHADALPADWDAVAHEVDPDLWLDLKDALSLEQDRLLVFSQFAGYPDPVGPEGGRLRTRRHRARRRIRGRLSDLH